MNKARTKKYVPSQDETLTKQRINGSPEHQDWGTQSWQHDSADDAKLTKRSFELTNQTNIPSASKNFQKPYRRAGSSSYPKTRPARIGRPNPALRSRSRSVRAFRPRESLRNYRVGWRHPKYVWIITWLTALLCIPSPSHRRTSQNQSRYKNQRARKTWLLKIPPPTKSGRLEQSKVPQLANQSAWIRNQKKLSKTSCSGNAYRCVRKCTTTKSEAALCKDILSLQTKNSSLAKPRIITRLPRKSEVLSMSQDLISRIAQNARTLPSVSRGWR